MRYVEESSNQESLALCRMTLCMGLAGNPSLFNHFYARGQGKECFFFLFIFSPLASVIHLRV